ncbi:MAG: hypothetical protein LBE35_06530 [Clostridiales bacterium]|jgi:hemerythrin-like metal-binding protein|nr:hypothetical protein [Clostridiales bacterium]
MWKDSYLIGNELLDRQHKLIFECAETLVNVLKLDLDFDEYVMQITEAIRFFKVFSVQHFKDEEEYQRQIGYKDREEHARMHTQLLADVLTHERALVSRGFQQEDVEKFLGFLMTWLVYHVAGEDQKMKGAFAEQSTEGLDAISSFAEAAKHVLLTMTGLSDGEIRPDFSKNRRIDEGVSFKVGLVGAGDKKGIGLVYSNIIALGAIWAMTGMEFEEINEMVHSALQEMSNILSSRIANAVAKGVGSSFIDIEHPVMSEISEIPRGEDNFIMVTSLGDLEITVY